MASLINTVGTSPMVVTEVLQYIRNTDSSMKNLALIYTEDRDVRTGINALVGAINSRYSDVHISHFLVDTDDILDYDSLIKFLEVFANVVLKYRNHGPIHLNVSGGRKIQGIALSMYATFAGIKTVYNVINRDVKNYNERYERIKNYLSEDFSDCSEDEAKIRYLRRKQIYDSVFFPDPSELYFLKIPVLTLPPSEKEFIRRSISGISLEDGEIEDFRIRAYYDSGFITFDRHRTYGTDLGKIISKLL